MVLNSTFQLKLKMLKKKKAQDSWVFLGNDRYEGGRNACDVASFFCSAFPTLD